MSRLLFAGLFCCAFTAGAADLDVLRANYRVIAVFTPTDSAGIEAAETLTDENGIVNRDIAWFVLSPSQMHSNLDTRVNRKTLARLHRADGFEAVLIGKDGGVKARQTEELDMSAFFDAIDRMPMRQQEIQQQQ